MWYCLECIVWKKYCDQKSQEIIPKLCEPQPTELISMKLRGWKTCFAYSFKGLIDGWYVEVGKYPLAGYLIGDDFLYDFYDLTSEENFQKGKDFKLCNCFYYSFVGVLFFKLASSTDDHFSPNLSSLEVLVLKYQFLLWITQRRFQYCIL